MSDQTEDCAASTVVDPRPFYAEIEYAALIVLRDVMESGPSDAAAQRIAAAELVLAHVREVRASGWA